MRRLVLALVTAASLWAGTAAANRDVELRALRSDDIRAEQQRIRQAADAGKGVFKGMKAAKRDALRAHQGKVLALVEPVAITTELPVEDQIALSNELQAIQAILREAEDTRMVCERRHPVGSHRPQTVCLTVAERRERHEEGHAEVQRRGLRCDEVLEGHCK